MTPTQREAALRLVDWLHASGVVNSEVKETIALLRELLAEPQGEPVAWIDSNGCPHHLTAIQTATERRLYGPWDPLYIHPPQQRKPLTDEQIYEALSDQVFWATSKNFILRVVRDTERAHDIGEAP